MKEKKKILSQQKKNNRKKISIFKTIILLASLIIYYYLTLMKENRYIFHMTYIKCFTLILFLFLFLYTYGIFDHKEKTYQNNIRMYIILYFIFLISVTFFIGRTSIKFYPWWYQGQYQPFHTIISQLKYGSNLEVLKNIIGNSIMLIPLSFLLMLKNKKYNSILKQTKIILPIIIGIEILQAYTHTGSFDIDDILLNYLGTVIFTLIVTRFSIIEKIKIIFYTDYKLKSKSKYMMFYSVTFFLIIYLIALLLKVF